MENFSLGNFDNYPDTAELFGVSNVEMQTYNDIIDNDSGEHNLDDCLDTAELHGISSEERTCFNDLIDSLDNSPDDTAIIETDDLDAVSSDEVSFVDEDSDSNNQPDTSESYGLSGEEIQSFNGLINSLDNEDTNDSAIVETDDLDVASNDGVSFVDENYDSGIRSDTAEPCGVSDGEITSINDLINSLYNEDTDDSAIVETDDLDATLNDEVPLVDEDFDSDNQSDTVELYGVSSEEMPSLNNLIDSLHNDDIDDSEVSESNDSNELSDEDDDSYGYPDTTELYGISDEEMQSFNDFVDSWDVESFLTSRDDNEEDSDITISFKGMNGDDDHDRSLIEQLDNQEAGLNAMTYGEFLENRENFLENGRENNQSEYREAAIESLLYDGDAETEEEAKEQLREAGAALHITDQIAGGSDIVNAIGDSSVNSSIGSQWAHGRAQSLEDQVRELLNEDSTRSEEYMNVHLKIDNQDD